MEKVKQEKNSTKNVDDEIKIFEKIKKLSIEQKKLICLYIITFLLIFQTVQPYVLKYIYESKQKDNENLTYDVSSFKEISANQLDLVASSEKVEIIYIGKSNCEFCLKFLPILKQAQAEYHYITNYIDINKVSESDKEKILKYDNADGFVKSNFGATPMIMSVQNGQFKEGWVGYAEYPNFEEFLVKSGLTK